MISTITNSCGISSPKSNKENFNSSLDKEWILDVNNLSEFNLKQITLTFNKKEKTINGFSGCNSFNGTFVKTGDLIAISSLNSSKMYCPENKIEKAYLELLSYSNSIKIEGNDLILMKENLELLKFHSK